MISETANLRENQDDFSPVLAARTGKYNRQGKGDYNPVLYTINGEIPVMVLIYIVL